MPTFVRKMSPTDNFPFELDAKRLFLLTIFVYRPKSHPCCLLFRINFKNFFGSQKDCCQKIHVKNTNSKKQESPSVWKYKRCTGLGGSLSWSWLGGYPCPKTWLEYHSPKQSKPGQGYTLAQERTWDRQVRVRSAPPPPVNWQSENITFTSTSHTGDKDRRCCHINLGLWLMFKYFNSCFYSLPPHDATC